MKRKWTIGRWTDHIGRTWYQVRYEERTIDQFLSRDEAESFKAMQVLPVPCLQRVSQKRGQVIRRINKYP